MRLREARINRIQGRRRDVGGKKKARRSERGRGGAAVGGVALGLDPPSRAPGTWLLAPSRPRKLFTNHRISVQHAAARLVSYGLAMSSQLASCQA